MEDVPESVSRLFTSSMALAHSRGKLRDLYWALPCLGHFVLHSFPCVTANPVCRGHNPFAFPCHETWSSAPPLLPKACTNTASLWGMLQPHVTVMNVLTNEVLRGDLDHPGCPPARTPLPQEDCGTTLTPEVCLSMLLTLLSLFTASSVWLKPAHPGTTNWAASYQSSLATEGRRWSGQTWTGTPQ